MKYQAKILTAVSIIAMMMVCVSAADISDDSSADTSEKIYITLNETLNFSDQLSAYSSVNKINQAAGSVVCEYSNDRLTFTKDIDMKLNISDSSKGVLIFDNSANTQYITVSEGVNVTVRYEGSKDTDGVGTIMKKGDGDLVLNGKGNLIVMTSVPKTFGMISENDIRFEGSTYISSTSKDCRGGVSCDNLYCDDGLLHIDSQSDGAVMSGDTIRFKNCDVKIYGLNYGIRCSELRNMTMDSCTSDIIGSTYCSISKNPTETNSNLTDIYGSDDVTSKEGRSSIGLGNVAYYKHVMSEPRSSINFVPIVIIIVVSILIVISIMIIIAVVVRNRRKHNEKSMGLIEHKEEHTDEEAIPDDGTDDDSGDANVMTQSFVYGVSFILVVDGKLTGFIDTQRSYVRIEPGMHEIVIITDEHQRKTVYQKNHLISHDTKIVVEKKLNNFTVKVI